VVLFGGWAESECAQRFGDVSDESVCAPVSGGA
jgi:hypothetical protein